MLIVGDKELKEGTVSVRKKYSGNIGVFINGIFLWVNLHFVEHIIKLAPFLMALLI